MMQVFGKWATRSILELEDKQIKEILSEKYLSLDLGIEDGYMIIAYKTRILGLGLYAKGTLHPQLSREAKRCLSSLPAFTPLSPAE